MLAVRAQQLRHRYGRREALGGLDLDVDEGEILALLGPNGSGKTTFFRLVTTYFSVQAGDLWVFGYDARLQIDAIRKQLGVVFQHPSLDKKLTVRENLWHHGRLHQLSSHDIRQQTQIQLARFAVQDRENHLVETLSGGLARRVELAKALLSKPRLLVLDEPSSGLDPGARRDLWDALRLLRQDGVTILLTTHLLDEAERSDKVAILDEGQLVGLGAPAALRSEVGGDVVWLQTEKNDLLTNLLQRWLDDYSWTDRAKLVSGEWSEGIRLECVDGYNLVSQLPPESRALIQAVSISKPTLEDVFLLRTGHRFGSDPWNRASSRDIVHLPENAHDK